jgi:alanine-synthesizing transaminase
MQQQARGIEGVDADHVFMGNGVSELIDLTLRGLLNPGDEVLIPSPDYPLWTAATVLNGGRAVYYPCPESQGFNPDPDAIEKLITPRTRAIVIINPNNPTGAVYSRERLTALARLAERHNLVVMSDEIYDQMLYDGAEFVPMATLCKETLCATFSGLSKIYRACGYRVGWVSFSGAVDRSEKYMSALDLLAALRLCSNVPGQWAVQTALGGFQSIGKLCSPGGRLYQSRQAIIDGVKQSRFLSLVAPRGAMYAFIGVDKQKLPGFDDETFAMELLEQQHVLIAPGSSFNTPYRDHFRITTLPEEARLAEVFQRIEHVLEHIADRPPRLETA